MFRRLPVLQNAGYWDCVRFAGDSEYVRRLKKVFGQSALHELSTGPLAFALQEETSLTGNNWFGFSGFFVGARRVYLNTYKRWHRETDFPYIDFPQKNRPFPVPAPMQPASRPKDKNSMCHLDVVMATDIRLPGGTIVSTLEEVEAQKALGLKTGLIHMARYDLKPTAPWNTKVLDLIDEQSLQFLVYGQKVSCDLLIIRHPPVLQEYQDFLPQVQARNVLVIVNQAPFRDYQDPDSRLYDVYKCRTNLERYFGNPGVWLPIGPAVRSALNSEMEAGIHLGDEDWVNIIDVQAWEIPRRKRSDTKPIIGRHSRDQYVKWPNDPEEMLAAYPAHDDFEVRILGGAKAARGILGRIPENWMVYPFNSLAVRDFLAQIDVFVYFTHPGCVEAFGRTPLEAMAAGVPVILPDKFKPLFQDAAIYATPFEVQTIVIQLHQDRQYYQQQAEKGRKFVQKNFGYAEHQRRLAQYVQRLQ
ncbi:MAG: glycosyltransferase [Desulfovermiculus sp.]